MDFHSVMETFAEAWVAANTQTPLTEAAEQGFINGPSNHATGNHGAVSHPPPNHSSLIPSTSLPVIHPPSTLIPGVHPPTNLTMGMHPLSNNTTTVTTSSQASVISTTLSHSSTSPISPSHGSINSAEPPPNVMQDGPDERRESDSGIENESSRVSGRQSPTESPNDCSSIGEIKSPYKTLSNPHGKSLPVHCIIEQIPGPQACGQYVELDSYAIVPNDTLFSDLVRTALGKLGYSGAQIVGAKGSIQIKKWKSLAFDQVTENPEATVADILGELTTVASLHVRLYSVPDNPQEWRDITVRNAVLELLREMSQSKLAKLCPLSQPMLSNIINNRYMCKIGKEKCQEFGQWYLSYRKEHPEGSTPEVVPSDRPVDGRLTFHPTKELPMMRDWFHGCRNPSRRALQMYVDVLNQGPVRQQERPKVVLSTLKNWWKNEKQRERKNMRSDDQSPSKDSNKIKKKKKTENPDNPKEVPNDNFSGSSSQEPPKTDNFTLINHSENESDTERFGKKEGEMLESENFISDSNHAFSQSTSILGENKSSNKFTIFSHVHPEGPVRDSHNKYITKDDEMREGGTLACESSHYFSPSNDSKPSNRFTIFSHIHPDGSIERFVRKDDEENSRSNGSIIHSPPKSLLHSAKDSVPIDPGIFHKLHPICIDHGHALFSYPEHPLNLPSSAKICCDTCLPVRTSMMDSNSHISSEDDVDVGI